MNRILFLMLFVFSAFSQLFAQYPEGIQLMNDNLVNNGDFSTGNRGFETAYRYTNEPSYDYGPTLDEGEYGVINNPKRIHSQFSDCQDRSGNGNMMVINGSSIDNEVVWSQKINVKKNTNYVFSSWIASAHATAPARLQFSINGNNHLDPINAPSTTCEWRQFSTLWKSEEHTSITISIVNKNTTPFGNDFLLDDITFYECINEKDPIIKTKNSTEAHYLHAPKDLTCEQLLILDNLKFHDNSTKFKGMIAANQTLFFIFNYMKENPTSMLTLYGHTDVFGSKERNLLLSKQRVQKIQRWLSMYGIKPHRIEYEWFGSSRPLIPEGDISNRRVEIKLSCHDLK